MRLLSNLFDWIFPPTCVHCSIGVESLALLCQECENLLEQCVIPNCELPGQTAAGRPVWGLWYYRTGSPIRTCHRLLKFEGHERAGSWMGKRAAASLQNRMKSNPCVGIVPIPSHRVKMLERGLLPTHVIASEISLVLHIPEKPNLMIRTALGPSQSALKRDERINNLKHAFALKDHVAGRHFLIVDDLLTTGATLDAAAALIEENGGTASLYAIAFRRETFGSLRH